MGPSAPAPSAGPALQPRSVAGARTRRIPSRPHAALCAPAERNRSRMQCSSRRDAKYQQLLAHAEERVFESVNEAVEAILAGSRRVGSRAARPGRCARARARACGVCAHIYPRKALRRPKPRPKPKVRVLVCATLRSRACVLLCVPCTRLSAPPLAAFPSAMCGLSRRRRMGLVHRQGKARQARGWPSRLDPTGHSTAQHGRRRALPCLAAAHRRHCQCPIRSDGA